MERRRVRHRQASNVAGVTSRWASSLKGNDRAKQTVRLGRAGQSEPDRCRTATSWRSAMAATGSYPRAKIRHTAVMLTITITNKL